MNVTILKMQKLTPAKVDLVAKPLLIPASSLIILLLNSNDHLVFIINKG